jgi:hypothetical protein
MLGVYLATVTKGVYHMHEVVEKLNVLFESGSGGRRFMPSELDIHKRTTGGPNKDLDQLYFNLESLGSQMA